MWVFQFVRCSFCSWTHLKDHTDCQWRAQLLLKGEPGTFLWLMWAVKAGCRGRRGSERQRQMEAGFSLGPKVNPLPAYLTFQVLIQTKYEALELDSLNWDYCWWWHLGQQRYSWRFKEGESLPQWVLRSVCRTVDRKCCSTEEGHQTTGERWTQANYKSFSII